MAAKNLPQDVVAGVKRVIEQNQGESQGIQDLTYYTYMKAVVDCLGPTVTQSIEAHVWGSMAKTTEGKIVWLDK